MCVLSVSDHGFFFFLLFIIHDCVRVYMCVGEKKRASEPVVLLLLSLLLFVVYKGGFLVHHMQEGSRRALYAVSRLLHQVSKKNFYCYANIFDGREIILASMYDYACTSNERTCKITWILVLNFGYTHEVIRS